MTSLKIFKTHSDIQLPRHQTTQSACFDIAFQSAGKASYKGYTSFNKPFTREMRGVISISPGDRVMVPTGLILDIPESYSVRIHARSGTSLKQGLVLANAEGVIDSDYIDELYILLHNISENTVQINNGDRIAQAELVKTIEYVIEQSATRPGMKTNRIGGMGSTGVISTDAGVITINIPQPIKNTTLKEMTIEKRGRGRPKKNVSNPSS
jgi:dUTP pyrophosphatase